jgi:[ribosomal protein S18]-alanine N-acetyltransferase
VTQTSARSGSQPKLRPGRIADLDSLVALERQYFTSDHQISRRGFRHFLVSSKSTLLVAEVDKRLAGCVLVNYRRGSRIARLYTIVVDREFQRRGIARRLLAAAENDATRRGRRVMRLEVREDDAGAHALYESSGYRLFGRRPGYYEGRIDALRFDKALPAGSRRGPAGRPVDEPA